MCILQNLKLKKNKLELFNSVSLLAGNDCFLPQENGTLIFQIYITSPQNIVKNHITHHWKAGTVTYTSICVTLIFPKGRYLTF